MRRPAPPPTCHGVHAGSGRTVGASRRCCPCGRASAISKRSGTGAGPLFRRAWPAQHHWLLATGQVLSRPLCLVVLAEVAGLAGQVAQGLHFLAEALAAFAATGRGEMLTEAYRLRGEVLLRQATSEAAQAEACFQQALALARRQQAKSWELRAALCLSRLWHQQGKKAAAHELLAPIYGWFTE